MFLWPINDLDIEILIVLTSEKKKRFVFGGVEAACTQSLAGKYGGSCCARTIVNSRLAEPVSVFTL